MAKRSEHPRLKTTKKAGKDGQIWVSYYYDMRGRGRPDVPLGTDKAQALIRWAEIQSGAVVPAKTRGRASTAQPAGQAPSRAAQGRRRNFSASVWSFAPAWAKPLYIAAERRSSAAGRAVYLSPEEFLAVVRRAGGACELTGLPFDVTRDKPKARRPFAPSLDRIDCSKGYTPGNVRLVCTIINCALGDFGEAPFRVAAEAFLARSAGAQLPQAGVEKRECESDKQENPCKSTA